MFRRCHGRVVAAALLVPLVMTLAACSEKDKEQAKKNASAPCPSSINGTATTQVPSDVPAPTGASSAYQSFSQGATKFWFFAIAGGPDQLASLRDSYDDTLKGQGYTIKGHDQEAGAEAESEFSGPHDGTTQFLPLCTGKVRIRLKLES